MAKPPAGSSLLFGALADSGQIKQNKNGSYRMVLDGVDEIDWFTDRPARVEGTWKPQKLPRKWDKYFATSEPNAQATVEVSGSKKILIFEMFKPKTKQSILQFKIEPISGAGIKNFSQIKNLDLSSISLFIDSSESLAETTQAETEKAFALVKSTPECKNACNISLIMNKKQVTCKEVDIDCSESRIRPLQPPPGTLVSETLYFDKICDWKFVISNLNNTAQREKPSCFPNCDNENFDYSNYQNSSIDFSNGSFKNSTFKFAALASANFDNADLTGADLSSSNLENAALNGTNLTNANLQGADLLGVSADGAIFSNTICPTGNNSDDSSDKMCNYDGGIGSTWGGAKGQPGSELDGATWVFKGSGALSDAIHGTV